MNHPTDLPGFVRNVPCPCGSGVKAKKCPYLWQARADEGERRRERRLANLRAAMEQVEAQMASEQKETT